MNMTEFSKKHVDSCRFCWMCHHICPIGNATGQERNTARARALGISLVNRDAIALEEIIDNIYECATCSACAHTCVTGWDPVLFTREARLKAALAGALPEYINILIDNCLDTGNAYGKEDISPELKEIISKHGEKTDTLLWLGTDARYMAPAQGINAVRVMEKYAPSFTVLEDEPDCGTHLDFLIETAEETKNIMQSAAAIMNNYTKVVIFDPADAKTIKRAFGEMGIELSCEAVTFTSFLAPLAKGEKTLRDAAIQDAFQLSRELGETEPIREIVSKYAYIREFLLNGEETVWAGNILMSRYMGRVIKKVAEMRISNAESIGAKYIITESVGEYVSLKSVKQYKTGIIALENLILGEY